MFKRQNLRDRKAVKFTFDKSLVKMYAESVVYQAKHQRRTIESAVAFQVYVARMCGQIPVDKGEEFHKVLLKAATKLAHVDKRSWNKQRA